MGSSSIKSFSIAFGVMAVTVYIFSPETFEPIISPLYRIQALKDILSRLHKPGNEELVTESQGRKGRLFTAEELGKYDGAPDSLGLYLAILGEVFDVSKGAQHYKPGSSYAIFAGRDSSRAYVTGDFENAENVDDVSGLDESAYSGLADWLSFYQDEYPHVGKIVGRYYDEQGNPTKELQMVREKIEHANTNKWLADNENNIFPPCNSEWSKEKGSRVWCTNKSGGIDRSWVGVPRQYHKPGKDARCVCVKDFGPSSFHPDAVDHTNVGDMEHPNLQEYPGCSAKSSSCKVEHP